MHGVWLLNGVCVCVGLARFPRCMFAIRQCSNRNILWSLYCSAYAHAHPIPIAHENEDTQHRWSCRDLFIYQCIHIHMQYIQITYNIIIFSKNINRTDKCNTQQAGTQRHCVFNNLMLTSPYSHRATSTHTHALEMDILRPNQRGARAQKTRTECASSFMCVCLSVYVCVYSHTMPCHYINNDFFVC